MTAQKNQKASRTAKNVASIGAMSVTGTLCPPRRTKNARAGKRKKPSKKSVVHMIRSCPVYIHAMCMAQADRKNVTYVGYEVTCKNCKTIMAMR